MYKFSNTQKGFLLIALLCNTHALLYGMNNSSNNSSLNILDDSKNDITNDAINTNRTESNYSMNNDSDLDFSNIISPIKSTNNNNNYKKMSRKQLLFLLEGPELNLRVSELPFKNAPHVFEDFKDTIIKELSTKNLRLVIEYIMGSKTEKIKLAFGSFTIRQNEVLLQKNKELIEQNKELIERERIKIDFIRKDFIKREFRKTTSHINPINNQKNEINSIEEEESSEEEQYSITELIKAHLKRQKEKSQPWIKRKNN